MKPQAILYLLWDKNIGVLREHVARVNGTTVLYYSPFGQTSPALIEATAPVRCLDIATLVDTNREQSAQAQLATVQEAAKALRASPEWQSYCDQERVDAVALAEVIDTVGAQHWPGASHMLQCLDAALERFDLRLVVLNEDVTSIGRLIAEWARHAGIKSVLLQHSILLGTAYTVHGGLHADVTAVFGTRGMDAYLDIGIEPERLVATGNPAWDVYRSLPAQRYTIRNQLLPRHGLDPAKPLVVFGTTWAANLTAHCNENTYAETLGAFLGAFKQLRDRHPQLQALVKDRVSNESLFRQQFDALLPSIGLPANSIAYATSDTESWVVAADVVIAVDSNMLVEAVLAGTPAVNLSNVTGFMIGPAFDADSGIADVEADELAPTVERLLNDGAWRKVCIEAGQRSRTHYQESGAGTAALRVAQLLESIGQFRSSTPGYVWQEYLDVDDIEATGYHGGARGDLVDMFSNNPRIVLDIGCAAGGTGELLKRKYPHCKVWGVETNRAAAKIASQRLDRVLVGMFEEFNLEQEGIAKGTLDGVILADVLEHMYNPWAVMTALQPYLSTTAQVIISIPNVRNLKLMEELAGGYWRYEPAGLLDITHIRFFTLKEFRRFLHETGFHVNTLRYGIDQRLHPFYEANKQFDRQNIEMGRMRLADVSREELGELCSLQFYINASLGAMPEDIRPYHASAPYVDYLKLRRLTEAQAGQYDKLIAGWTAPPGVLILVNVEPGQEERLTTTVKNLRGQLYQHISIAVVSVALPPDGVPLSDRFQWLTLQNGLAEALSKVATSTDHDWVAWVNAGDLLEPQALLSLVEAVQRKPEWRFVYSDEDMILGESEFGEPVFKPDFDAQFLLSMPYLGGFCAIRRDALQALGGTMPEMAGAEQIDLALRVWQRWGAKVVGHLDSILYHRSPESGQQLVRHVQAAQQAVNHALSRTGLPIAAEAGWRPGVFRWSWQGETSDLVSILIPVRDELPKLQRTLEGLLAHTRHEAFEILIVDNGSVDAETNAFLQGLDALGDPRLKVFRFLDRVGLPSLYNL
ncbi:MAG: glycosyltransferase, partial [Burkholderiales bacterium]|nr:glycosyltransferase [Burkholderiales bacterium]